MDFVFSLYYLLDISESLYLKIGWKSHETQCNGSNLILLFTCPTNYSPRITTSSLTNKLSNKFLVPLLVPSLPNPMCACLWIKLKLLFLKPNSYSLWCGLDILTIFFLSGHMVSKNSKLFCVVLMSSILTSNLLMSQAKKALHFSTLKLVLKTVRLLQIWM